MPTQVLFISLTTFFAFILIIYLPKYLITVLIDRWQKRFAQKITLKHHPQVVIVKNQPPIVSVVINLALYIISITITAGFGYGLGVILNSGDFKVLFYSAPLMTSLIYSLDFVLYVFEKTTGNKYMGEMIYTGIFRFKKVGVFSSINFSGIIWFFTIIVFFIQIFSGLMIYYQFFS